MASLVPELVPDLGWLLPGPVAGTGPTWVWCAGNVASNVVVLVKNLLVLPGSLVVSVSPDTAVGLGQLLHPLVQPQASVPSRQLAVHVPQHSLVLVA